MAERINKRTHSDYTQMAAYLPKKLVSEFKHMALEMELGNSEAVEEAITEWCQRARDKMLKKMNR